MTTARGKWPYRTVDVDGSASVDADGENQTCACGNDSATQDWRAANQQGHLTFEASGSSDPAEHAVCPVCGRVYLNADLFADDRCAEAVARYDTADPRFVAALVHYDHDAYGSQAGSQRSAAKERSRSDQGV
jgi:hypothetical protein